MSVTIDLNAFYLVDAKERVDLTKLTKVTHSDDFQILKNIQELELMDLRNDKEKLNFMNKHKIQKTEYGYRHPFYYPNGEERGWIGHSTKSETNDKIRNLYVFQYIGETQLVKVMNPTPKHRVQFVRKIVQGSDFFPINQ